MALVNDVTRDSREWKCAGKFSVQRIYNHFQMPMKKLLLFFVFLAFCAASLSAQQASAPKMLQKKQVKADDPSLPFSPLTVNGSTRPEINLGRVFKISQRMFKIEIENPSDKDVEYTGVVLNCDCTTIITKLPPAGVIPAKGKLKIVMRMDATALGNEKRFFRMMRMELKGYRHFVVSIVGQVSNEMAMVFDDDPERKARTRITVGCLSDVENPWQTSLSILSRLPEEEEFQLGSVEAHGDFTAAMYHVDGKTWRIALSNVTPMKPGIIKAALMIPLLKPAPPAGMQDVIFLPIIGVCGAKINATVENLYNDPKSDPQVVTKRFALTREPYMDTLAVAAVIQGRPNPYVAMLDILKVEELEIPKIPGVEFKLTQGSKGVFVDCTMDRSKMTEKGAAAVFKLKKGYDEAAEVIFAILSEEKRQQIEADKRHAEKIEEAERAAQAEQDALQ